MWDDLDYFVGSVMVWVLERLREELPKYASISPCVWESIDESNHFKMQQRKSGGVTNSETICSFCKELQSVGGGHCILCGELWFRIIYIAGSVSLVVAKADAKSEIQSHWNHLKANIQPMLRILSEDSSKEKPKTETRTRNIVKNLLLPLSPRKSPRLQDKAESTDNNQINDFVKLKLASIIKDDPDFQSKIEWLKNETNFRSHFPSVGPDESLKLRMSSNCNIYTDL